MPAPAAVGPPPRGPQNAWKLAHPTTKYNNRAVTDDSTPYEKAVKFNYSREEQAAMVELISLVKSLQREMLELSPDFYQLIRSVPARLPG